MSKTNFDRIKEMEIEEMAEFLLKTNARNTSITCNPGDCIDCHKDCKDCFKEWLEREVEENV